ncbi:hypothetical protein P5673_031317 [Acropora cervicornis]|uniref:Uncharacterized protein n=1 Tax=Acropora cervicornis TaxID=6130 RepID=A0AAD9PTT7_ACRCE|nr:hypothetical protein P5673_031317 [Acropora cervicornis]
MHYPKLPTPNLDTDRKITLLKNNKATGPDDISPKLLKLAVTAVVGLLTSLFMQSIRECRVYNNWKVARLTPVRWPSIIIVKYVSFGGEKE